MPKAIIPACPKCSSIKIERTPPDNKKREVTRPDIRAGQMSVDGLPTVVYYCGDCGAILSCQVVDISGPAKTAGGIIIP